MSRPGSTPRWSLAALTAPLAALLGWGALALPVRGGTLFAVATGAVALAHAATAALALAGHPARGRAFRLQAILALVYLGWLTWMLAASAAQIAALYGGLGEGVAAALALVWAGFALPILPLSIWGIAATGGLRLRRRGAAGAAGLALLAAGAVGAEVREAGARPLAQVAAPLAAALRAGAAPEAPGASAPPLGPRPPLPFRAPVRCEGPLDRPTALLGFVDAAGAPRAECLQDRDAAGLRARIVARLGTLPGPAIVDEILAAAPVASPALPALAGLLVRPGQDGVCAGTACFAPWQLVATDAFAAYKPIASIPDLRFGVDAAALRRQLGAPEGAPLVRIETRATALDGAGRSVALRRGKDAGPALDASSLREALAAARAHVLGAQEPDGRFAYVTHPFTGERTMAGFGIPRQAGTTMALCELGAGGADHAVTGAARDALGLLRGFAYRRHDLAGMLPLPHPPEARLALGPAALSLVAFLACRPLVGPAFDAEIGALGRFLLRLQRPDGGFFPAFDTAEGTARRGREPLYAGGQALLALVLLEAAAAESPGAPLPAAEAVRAAVGRAMSFYAERYWPAILRPFFFLEENWHCLAARAALPRLADPRYERLCLDYVASRHRLVLDEDDGVDESLVGGFGFGNVVPPQNTPSAGNGEALAAAIAIKDARGLDASAERRTLARTLRFLLRNQWRTADCFACPRPELVVGGFSESLAAPQIRIDYVQHAWAALGHGGRVLGLLAGGAGAPAPDGAAHPPSREGAAIPAGRAAP